MLGAESDGGLHNNPVEGAQALGSLAEGGGGLHNVPVVEVLSTISGRDYTLPELGEGLRAGVKVQEQCWPAR